MKKIGVLGGMGHVGLVTAACLAEVVDQVCVVDVDEKRIKRLLEEKKMPFYEPSLRELVIRYVNFEDPNNGRLVFECVKPGEKSHLLSETYLDFIIVPTPTKPGDTYDVDLSCIEQSVQTIALSSSSRKIIALKSTSPPWTINLVEDTLAKYNNDAEFHFVVNPETLAEGRAVKDFRHPDRVIVGSNSQYAMDELTKLYLKFDLNESGIKLMGPIDASLVKYEANNWLAKEIGFNDELADLCQAYGANYDKVSEGVRSDRRIGGVFIYCGPGYGGSCFPKDTKGIMEIGKRKGIEMKITQATIDVNERTKRNCFKTVDNYYQRFANGLEGKKVCVWGSAFKSNTSDVQESATLTLTQMLLKAGAKVIISDPEALEEMKNRFGDKIEYCKDKYEAVKGSDCLVVMTEWRDYRMPDFHYLHDNLRDKVVFDFRNLYDKRDAQEAEIDIFIRGHDLFRYKK